MTTGFEDGTKGVSVATVFKTFPKNEWRLEWWKWSTKVTMRNQRGKSSSSLFFYIYVLFFFFFNSIDTEEMDRNIFVSALI